MSILSHPSIQSSLSHLEWNQYLTSECLLILDLWKKEPWEHKCYLCWLSRMASAVSFFSSSLIPFPHFWQTDWDRSGPDLDCSSSKRNWLCSPKHGETELEQIQKDLGDPDLRPDRFWWWMKLYMYYRNRMEMKQNGVPHPQ